MIRERLDAAAPRTRCAHRRAPGAERPRACDRARVAVLLELGEDRAQPRAGRHARLADELVAAHERQAGRVLARRGEQLARDLEVAGDRGVGVAAARGERGRRR